MVLLYPATAQNKSAYFAYELCTDTSSRAQETTTTDYAALIQRKYYLGTNFAQQGRNGNPYQSILPALHEADRDANCSVGEFEDSETARMAPNVQQSEVNFVKRVYDRVPPWTGELEYSCGALVGSTKYICEQTTTFEYANTSLRRICMRSDGDSIICGAPCFCTGNRTHVSA